MWDHHPDSLRGLGDRRDALEGQFHSGPSVPCDRSTIPGTRRIPRTQRGIESTSYDSVALVPPSDGSNRYCHRVDGASRKTVSKVSSRPGSHVVMTHSRDQRTPDWRLWPLNLAPISGPDASPTHSTRSTVGLHSAIRGHVGDQRPDRVRRSCDLSGYLVSNHGRDPRTLSDPPRPGLRTPVRHPPYTVAEDSYAHVMVVAAGAVEQNSVTDGHGRQGPSGVTPNTS